VLLTVYMEWRPAQIGDVPDQKVERSACLAAVLEDPSRIVNFAFRASDHTCIRHFGCSLLIRRDSIFTSEQWIS
jgi:hypothetical protein